MSKQLIAVDTYVNLDIDGVSYTTYIGESDVPVVESAVEWDELVSWIVDAECLPNDGSIVVDFNEVDFLRTDGVQEILKQADALRIAADELEAAVRAKKVFMRHEWEKAGRPQDAVDQFTVTYYEYLDAVVKETQ